MLLHTSGTCGSDNEEVRTLQCLKGRILNLREIFPSRKMISKLGQGNKSIIKRSAS